MKPLEILLALPQWANASPDAVLDSPAFAMPCRLGDENTVLRLDAPIPADTLDLAIRFGDAPHVLSLARSPRFPDLSALWDTRADVPVPILLALVEKECGSLLQLLENAVRRQLALEGLSSTPAPPPILSARVDDISFALTRTPVVAAAFGIPRNLDLASPDLRANTLPAETEYATFALPAADLASLAPGDALLLSEIGTIPSRTIVDARFVLDASGVAPFTDDSRCRVVAAEPASIPLGTLFDAADGTPPNAPPAPSLSTPLRLILSGRTIATGHLDRLGDHPAFLVESVDSTKLGSLVVG